MKNERLKTRWPATSTKPAASWLFPLRGALSTLFMLVCMLMPFGVSAASAEEPAFELLPRWVRPGDGITMKLGPRTDLSRKLVLRLSGNCGILDLPVASDQIHRRVAALRIPPGTASCLYQSSLVDDTGTDLGLSGPKMKIAASDKTEAKPVITKIVPAADYPKKNRYTFEIIGQNFGEDINGIKILLNDRVLTFHKLIVTRGKRDSTDELQQCQAGQEPGANVEADASCLVLDWKKLGIYNLSLDKMRHIRPMAVNVAVDGIESDKRTIILSPVDRTTPILIAVATMLAATLLVYLLSRKKAALYRVNGRKFSAIAFLFIDPKTNTYSLSHLQLLLWSAAAILAYSYLAVSRALVQWDWRLCEVPENLPLLLGISAGTTVLSVGATGIRGSKGAGSIHPEWGDFISSGGVFAPERLQFFLWTVIGVFTFIGATLVQDPASVTDLPKIPDSFIPLMGISSIGYLAGKVTRKPGPNINRMIRRTVENVTSLHLLGEHLSPKAQIKLDGKMQTAAILAGESEKADAEFVTELILPLQSEALATAASIVVEVINPDGQCAQKSELTDDQETPGNGLENGGGANG